MTELPQGWEVKTFGDLFHRLQYGLTAKADHNLSGLRFLRITDIKDAGLIDWNLVPSCVGADDDVTRYRLADGDFVFARSGSIEKAARVKCPPPAVFASYLIRGVPLNRERADWLAWFIRSSLYLEQIRAAAAGIGLSNVNATKLSAVVVPIPPLPEQLLIVRKLDTLFERSKSAREDLARIPRLVMRYKQSILAAAFRGELTADWLGKASAKAKDSLATGLAAIRSAYFRQAGIKEKPVLSPSWTPNLDLPGTWEFVSVDQLTTLVQYGSSAKTSEALTKGVPVLRMGNIFEGQLDYTNLKYLPASHDEFPELLLRDGDILFNRTNSAELVGKTAVYSDVGHPISFASYLIRLRVVGYLPELLSAYINSAFGRAWVRSVVNQQVGQANVNGTKLRELGVPMMPMDEQKELWSRINRAFTIIEHLSKEATRATELLDRLDQATLGKAFQGGLLS
jgi:type I restriction enzyme, S subunit